MAKVRKIPAKLIRRDGKLFVDTTFRITAKDDYVSFTHCKEVLQLQFPVISHLQGKPAVSNIYEFIDDNREFRANPGTYRILSEIVNYEVPSTNCVLTPAGKDPQGRIYGQRFIHLTIPHLQCGHVPDLTIDAVGVGKNAKFTLTVTPNKDIRIDIEIDYATCADRFGISWDHYPNRYYGGAAKHANMFRTMLAVGPARAFCETEVFQVDSVTYNVRVTEVTADAARNYASAQVDQLVGIVARTKTLIKEAEFFEPTKLHEPYFVVVNTNLETQQFETLGLDYGIKCCPGFDPELLGAQNCLGIFGATSAQLDSHKKLIALLTKFSRKVGWTFHGDL